MDSNIRISVNDIPLNLKTFVFSGGEVQVRILNVKDIPETGPKNAEIFAKIYNSDQLMELFLYTSVLQDSVKTEKINLTCPYLPYARQDRACYEGEAFSLKVLCEMLNKLQYKKIDVWDVHSPYSLYHLSCLRNITAADLIKKYFFDSLKQYQYVVSPDKGAVQRAYEVSCLLQNKLLKAEKVRDPNTGAILRTAVLLGDEKPVNSSSIIVDDICDGGRTFIELAKELKAVGFSKIGLYVTHGIFSKGFGVFDGLIDEIYTPNLFPNKEEVPSFVKTVVS